MASLTPPPRRFVKLRRLLLRLGMSLCLPLLTSLPHTARADTPVLRVLAWPGYVESEVVREFEARHQVRVELTFIDTDEALWQKVTATQGPAFDVFAVNTAELQRYVASNHVQPIDTTRIPNIERQQPRFRQTAAIPGLVRPSPHGERVYAIPFTYSAMGLIYDKRQMQVPPSSIHALWDSQWRGKVIAYNGGSHNFSLAAQTLGLTTPFHIPPDQLEPSVTKLIELRRNALGFYTQPEESVHLFVRHKAALMFANYGMQQVHLLRAAGVDVGYVIPREGALAWLDCWAIPRDAHHAALAHAWINHLLDRTASQLLVTRQGLANTVDPVDQRMGGSNLVWLQPVEDAAQRERLWGRIHTGNRLSKVLTP